MWGPVPQNIFFVKYLMNYCNKKCKHYCELVQKYNRIFFYNAIFKLNKVNKIIENSKRYFNVLFLFISLKFKNNKSRMTIVLNIEEISLQL